MKDINYYLNLKYKMEIIEDDEGGYTVYYPELKGCITCADSIEEGITLLKDAKKEWIEAAIDDGVDIPEPLKDEEFSGQFKLRMPRSLHRELMESSKAEGTSMNQYCLYLLSKGVSKNHSIIK